MEWTTEQVEALQKQLNECREANISLAQQCIQIKAAIHQVPIGVMITSSSDNTVVMMNPEMEKLTGLSRGELVGKHFTREFQRRGGNFNYLEKTDGNPDYFHQHFLSDKHLVAKDFEFILIRPDGSNLVISMSSSPLIGDDNETVAIISIVNDITERKNRENFFRDSKKNLETEVAKKTQDLKAMNWQLQTIFNTSSESLWVCDGDGKVLSINRATEKLLGIKTKDVVGKNIDQLVEDGFMDASVTRKVLGSGQQTSMIQHTLKTKRQLLVTGTPVLDDDGRISMVIVNERDLTQLNQLQEALHQAKNESRRFKDELTELHQQGMAGEEIIAASKQMNDILMISRKLAAMRISNILILGESGTGKSLLAKYIHKSGNPKGPLVTINCAALPENLLEAELFGYEKGAFTGARDQGKIGLFEMANDGTLFLDEIGELPLELQAKLLHCLEEKEIMHLGGLKPIKINCNIIAATNVNLARQVKNKTFRNDLFFRLNTFSITIPPLRDRKEDILELSLHLLKKYNAKYDSNRQITTEEIKKIQDYQLPGNVRELKSIIKKMIVLADTNSVDSIIKADDTLSLPQEAPPPADLRDQGLKQAVAVYEKNILLSALQKHSSTRALARHLHISQSQVVRKLSEHNLSNRLKHIRK